MIDIAFCYFIAILEDNGRHDRYFMKCSPSCHCAVGKAVFKQAENLIRHLASAHKQPY
jgi:hypothetical protein